MNEEKLAQLEKHYCGQAMPEVPLVTCSPEYRELRHQIVEELINP